MYAFFSGGSGSLHGDDDYNPEVLQQMRQKALQLAPEV
jgi:hypothetical protein